MKSVFKMDQIKPELSVKIGFPSFPETVFVCNWPVQHSKSECQLKDYLKLVSTSTQRFHYTGGGGAGGEIPNMTNSINIVEESLTF